jgi:hypothetical protein
VRRARLTPAGLDERAELDRRSDALAVSVLEPLSEAQRELVAAMAEVERLLDASAVAIAVEDPAGPTPGGAWSATSPRSTSASTRASTRRSASRPTFPS